VNYWVFKIEPAEMSIDDLERRGSKGAVWEGVRNYQARNLLRDGVAEGDRVFIYHSSCANIGIAGIARVIRTAYPDPSQFDSKSPYYDPGSSSDKPRWIAVDVRHERTFKELIPLAALKANAALADLAVVQKGSPASAAEAKVILGLGGAQ
jgi:predicted RNA-binding protein with PUA-like domain